jgi:Glycosyl hydrolase family 1
MILSSDDVVTTETSSLLSSSSSSRSGRRFHREITTVALGAFFLSVVWVVVVPHPQQQHVPPPLLQVVLPNTTNTTNNNRSHPHPDLPFPDHFVWGVATSAYQIEGAVQERGRTIWDAFCEIPGSILDGSTGNIANDHYHLFTTDVALMKSLNVRAYRFSIAWSRLLPTGRHRDSVSATGIQFYHDLIDELLRQNIEPWITLFHWDLPLALQEDDDDDNNGGGWLNVTTISAFVDYAELVFQEYGHKVKRFITINEPWT